jgi:hypothetical protein
MKNKYKALALVFGAGSGLCIGILTHNIEMGVALGAGVGIVLGTTIKTGGKKRK